jgi:hypothetical protein
MNDCTRLDILTSANINQKGGFLNKTKQKHESHLWGTETAKQLGDKWEAKINGATTSESSENVNVSVVVHKNEKTHLHGFNINISTNRCGKKFSSESIEDTLSEIKTELLNVIDCCNRTIAKCNNTTTSTADITPVTKTEQVIQNIESTTSNTSDDLTVDDLLY